MPPFPRGQSGNKAGRPPNNRLLSTILAEAGEVEVRGLQGIERRHYLAECIWRYVTEGEVTLANGQQLKIRDGREWLEAAKFLYQQIDGAPKPDLFAGDIEVRVVRGGAQDDGGDEEM